MPVISNTETIGNRRVIRGIQDKDVNLTCTSSGGYPEPTVKWTTDSSDLASTKTTEIASDGTYTVTVEFIFIALRSNDRVTYFCKSVLNAQEDVSNVTLYHFCK
ncbi:MAG: immunoglobulin domain-containing protein [Candidatus Thiodiazotropha sp.]